MTDLDHIHDSVRIIYAIHHPIVAHADAPQGLWPVDFASPMRPGVLSQALDLGKDPHSERRNQSFQFPTSRAREGDCIVSHSIGTGLAGGFVFLRIPEFPEVRSGVGGPQRRRRCLPKAPSASSGQSRRPFFGPAHLQETGRLSEHDSQLFPCCSLCSDDFNVHIAGNSQYFGTEGSTWSLQARMPPRRFLTLRKPAFLRKSTALPLRWPLRQ